MNIYQLREEELAAAYQAAVDALNERLTWPDTTYASLAESIGVREDSLKKFVARLPDVLKNQDRIRRGSVFLKVHSALVAREGTLEVPVNRELSKAQRLKGYTFINAMLGTKASAIAAAGDTVLSAGRFMCFRNSTDRAVLAVSELAFRNIGTRQNAIWEFEHHFIEGDNSQKMAEGPVVVMDNVIYLFGDVELGEGLEIFVLVRPGRGARFISGTTFSRDRKGVPFVANVMLIEAHDGDRQFELSDIRRISEQGFVPKHEIKGRSLGDDLGFGQRLLEQLKGQRSETVSRIGPAKIL